ncbi:unnamed protein product [Mycena citricolor]|uniref:Aminotransferase class V domain-containing protein n=1 Tax=Mycena citricolor TaxID=2018698 RepID=A0AAD2HZA9_9AGAR|nr:unnamed protein product [Mycena citricolor]
MPALDVAFVRSHFPAFSKKPGFVFAENAGGSQIIQSSIDRLTDYLISTNVQFGAGYELSIASTDRVMGATEGARELFNAASADEVVFGPSSTANLENLARAIEKDIKVGDEFIVTGEHEANCGPWKKLAERTGAVIKYWISSPTAANNPYSHQLKIEELLLLITSKTRLVAFPAVSNLLGSVVPVAEVSKAVRAEAAAKGAAKVEISVDCVAYAPHRRMDVQAWDVEYCVFSYYKVYGPHVSALYIRKQVMESSVASIAHHFIPTHGAYKLQPGGPGYEAVYGTTAIVPYLQSLVPEHDLTTAFAAIAEHETQLVSKLLGFLTAPEQRARGVLVVGVEEVSADRVPTISFIVAGDRPIRSTAIVDVFDKDGRIGIRYGHMYAYTLASHLPPPFTLDDGAVRVSLVHYNTLEEVDMIIESKCISDPVPFIPVASTYSIDDLHKASRFRYERTYFCSDLVMSDSESPTHAQDLQKLGYEQEMTRSRGLSQILFTVVLYELSSGIAEATKRSWPFVRHPPYCPFGSDERSVAYGLAAPLATSLAAGGPATILWGWLLVSLLTLPLALSLGEICAKYPTSAGAYYWCFRLASSRRRLLLSWFNGWLTLVGVWTAGLSVTFGTTQLIIAGAGIYLPDWEAKPWQTYVIFLAVTAVTLAFCAFFNSILPLLDIISAYWTILGVIVTLVCVSAKAAAGRHSAAFALGHFDSGPSGWTPGWGFFIGLLPPAYTFAGMGMIASMAEEVRDPSRNLPRAIVWSIPIGFLTGVLFLVPILFTLPDIATLISVSSGQPIGLLFELIMGSKGGGFGLWFIIFGIGMFCAISIACAASRSTWAFARDSALPFHRTFSVVHPHLGVPLNALLLSTAIQLALGLLYLGSSTAFNAFVAVAVICLGASYTFPIAVSLFNGRKDMHDSPFPLGRFGAAMNGIAVVWVAFQLVLFSMPPAVPVTRQSMNYASVVFVGFAAISAVWYLISEWRVVCSELTVLNDLRAGDIITKGHKCLRTQLNSRLRMKCRLESRGDSSHKHQRLGIFRTLRRWGEADLVTQLQTKTTTSVTAWERSSCPGDATAKPLLDGRELLVTSLACELSHEHVLDPFPAPFLSAMAESESSTHAQDLQKLGYEQEMTRSRGLFHILFSPSLRRCVSAASLRAAKRSWPSVRHSPAYRHRSHSDGRSTAFGLAAPFATSLAAGGPATILWGWLLVSLFALPLALSLGEICSKYPTSAGAYYWCFRLASPRWRLLLSWFNGWLTTVGVWTISLSVTFVRLGSVLLLRALVCAFVFRSSACARVRRNLSSQVLGYIYQIGRPNPGRLRRDVIFLGVTAVALAFCTFFNGILPLLDIISAYWTILGVIVTLVCVSAKAAAGRHSAAFALGHFDSGPSGWTPGWGFFIGLLPPAYTFAGIGMIAGMAEEVRDPSRNVPRAIVWSIPIGFLTGVLFLVPILFTLPDIATLISVSSGQPIGLLFELIMGSKGGGFGLWFISTPSVDDASYFLNSATVFGIGMFCAISISCAASRSTWAFARDGALPFHRTFSVVHPHLGVPLNALLLSTAIQLALGLLYLGSSTAFNAFVAVAVICLGASYTFPIAVSLSNGRKDMHDSPFPLGRFGAAMNGIAVVWVAFELVLFSMPPAVPVTRQSMNYASVVFVGFGAISAVWYLISGRHHYKGPQVPEDSAEQSFEKSEMSP